MFGLNNGLDGLAVRGGRLINERTEECSSGIYKAAVARKELKRSQKMDRMAEAVYRGTKRAEMDEKDDVLRISLPGKMGY